MRLRHLKIVVLGLCMLCGSPITTWAAAAHDTHSAGASAAAEEFHVDTNQPPINPNLRMLQLFLFSLCLFGGFVLAARTLLWRPLIAALDEREGRISRAHDEAEKAKHQAEQLLAKHSARMAEVHEEVQGIVAQARKEAEQEKTRIIAEAEAQATSLRQRAVAEIHSARDAALGQLHGALDQQVARAVEQVVGHVV